MQQIERSWYSPSMDRQMTVARWGHWGRPVVLFPTSGGDHLDVARFKLIEALRPLIEAGRIKVYAVGSMAPDGWADRDCEPARKVALQARYDRYLARELAPFVRADCGGARVPLIAAGASLGAFFAVAATARHPELFSQAIGMSGYYALERQLGDYRDAEFYFQHPLFFLPNLGEGPALERLRGASFLLASGHGRWEHPDHATRLAKLLIDKRIPVRLEFWDRRWDHDWPTWRAMLPRFLGELA